MATLASVVSAAPFDKDVKKAPEIVITALAADDSDTESDIDQVSKSVTEIHIQELKISNEAPAVAEIHGEAVLVGAEVEASPENTAEIQDHDPTTALLALANQTHLISSPYPDALNQLDLSPLTPQAKLFALALTTLTPTTSAYATAPYMTSFNWPSVFSTLRALCSASGIKWTKQEFYIVVFRSVLKEGIDRERLGLLDQKSHEEACQSGGLLKYWFGTTDSHRQNLATCLWLTREDAAAGGKGPWHKKARGAAREMYESISFHTHMLMIEDGAEAWELQDYQG